MEDPTDEAITKAVLDMLTAATDIAALHGVCLMCLLINATDEAQRAVEAGHLQHGVPGVDFWQDKLVHPTHGHA